MDENNKFLSKLSQNLLEILDDKDGYYDITIEVGNDPYVKIFRAHMNILNYRSPYFRNILLNDKKNKDNEALLHIKLPNILPETFQIILRYIYGGKFSLKEYDDASVIINILVSANELNLQELVDYLQTSLIENYANWMEQNFDSIYKTSFENDSFLQLQKYCTRIISKEPDKIFKSPNFSSTPEKLLVSIIQSNNLQMNEIQVWKHVLKWGIAQNSEIPPNPKSLSKNDINTLKNILQQFIPFIKFFNLSHKEFLSEVYPHRKVLPKELREKLIIHFLNYDESGNNNNNSESNITREVSEIKEIKETKETKEIMEIRPKSIDSKIITSQHSELISKWIDKLEIKDEIKNSYEFKLLLRGSRDEFTIKKFHEICDNQSHTVTIIKIKDNDEVIGGYNPIMWKSLYNFGTTKDSFIFSFKNSDKFENNILSRVRDEKDAIRNNPNYGPSFGNCDIVLSGKNLYDRSYCAKNSYEKSIRETNNYFSVEEYEVFQINKY